MMSKSTIANKFLLFSAVILLLSSCQQAYYGSLAKLGIEKRDVLISRINKARNTQAEGQEQFVDALTAYKQVVSMPESDLERTYKKLNSEYEDSREIADSMNSRVKDVESVSKALFKEWEKELKSYQSNSLRNQSEKKLLTTKREYRELISLMKKANKRVEPVLAILNDQVLFLKHNLNASAISSLRGEYNTINTKVDSLVRDMQIAIDEADRFISQMKSN